VPFSFVLRGGSVPNYSVDLMPSMPSFPEPGPAYSKEPYYNNDEKGKGHLVHYISPLSI